ncbi:Inositol-pentakisphosphate 2-kinase [Popillia japonica]|uniref:Inositol-pentakisphosphate 2-kinase n=1 Tax=Popillia japonica TaxID=7064 RepID=A0AAW1IYK8_POPJA
MKRYSIDYRVSSYINRIELLNICGFRKHKKLQFGRATFFTDFAFLPKNLDSFRLSGATYAIEIKPKQGWIPKQSRQSKCQFCQNQYLKLQKNQIKKISGYCPLDLFSGDKQRMVKAIKSLIYNPQNNFRIFRNGVFIYGEQVSIDVFYDVIKEMLYSDDKMSTYSLLEEFCDMLYATLIKQIDKQYTDHKCLDVNHIIKCSDQYGATYDDSISSGCDLPEGCILERILSIQKFDQLGLDYYKSLINTYLDNVEVQRNYVENLLKEVSAIKCPKCVIKVSAIKCPKCVISKCINKNLISRDRRDICELDFAPYLVASVANDCSLICELDFAPYLVASVANDCSLMLTYRSSTIRDQLVPEECFLERPNGNFVVNIVNIKLFRVT